MAARAWIEPFLKLEGMQNTEQSLIAANSSELKHTDTNTNAKNAGSSSEATDPIPARMRIDSSLTSRTGGS
jgi:hypothetical protein